MDWIARAQDRDRWRAVMYVGFRKMPGTCGLVDDVLASQEGLCSKEFVICIGCMRTKYFPSKPDSCCKTSFPVCYGAANGRFRAPIGRNFWCYTVLYVTSEISLNLVELFAVSKCHVWYVCVYVCMYVCIYIYIYIYICVCVCVCLFVM